MDSIESNANPVCGARKLGINELYDRAGSGDVTARELLFSELSVRFMAFTAQRIDDTDACKDIVQNAMLTISEQFSSIEITVSFSAWAHQVLKYRILKYFSDRKRKIKNEDNYQMHKNAKASGYFDPLLESKLIDCLKQVSRHNQYYARTLNLYYQGFRTEDVCDKLHISANHVYVILSRARSMLKSCLEEGGPRI